MQIAARVGTTADSGIKPLVLPREVAYLESDGNQFIKIETGLESAPSFTSSKFVVFDEPAIFLYSHIFYTSGGRSHAAVRTNQGELNLDVVVAKSCILKYGVVYETFSKRSAEWWIKEDGNVVASGVSGTAYGGTSPITIAEHFIGRIIRITLADKYDLVPYLDAEGIPCLMDVFSGRCFYNSGTGGFSWGELDAASGAFPTEGGGYNRKCIRRSHRRSARSSARFCAHSQEWEVAA